MYLELVIQYDEVKAYNEINTHGTEKELFQAITGADAFGLCFSYTRDKGFRG